MELVSQQSKALSLGIVTIGVASGVLALGLMTDRLLSGASSRTRPAPGLAGSQDIPSAIAARAPHGDSTAAEGRELAAHSAGESAAPETCTASARCRWTPEQLPRESANLAWDLRDGSVALDGILEFADSLLAGVDRSSSVLLEDGSKEYAIVVPEELGVAKLRVRPERVTDQPRYEILVSSLHSQHDSIRDEFTLGSRLEIRFGFDAERANHCSALAYTDPKHSRELLAVHGKDGWIAVGGSLSVSPGSSQWTPVLMKISDADGELRMEQRTADSKETFDRLQNHVSLAKLAKNLSSLD